MSEKQIYIPKELTTGYGFVAPLGTALPQDPTADLPAAFTSYGRIGEDGVTRSFESDTEETKDMFGNTLTTELTSDSETFQFKMVDANDASLATFYGPNAVVKQSDGGYVLKSNSSWSVPRIYAFRFILEATDTTTTYGLIVIPNGKISERGEQTIKGSAIMDHDVTINALPDNDGNRAYLYISAPQPNVAPTVTYTEVTPIGSESPYAEGWYERVGGSGTDIDPYVYSLSADTEVDDGNTYYERTIG